MRRAMSRPNPVPSHERLAATRWLVAAGLALALVPLAVRVPALLALGAAAALLAALAAYETARERELRSKLRGIR